MSDHFRAWAGRIKHGQHLPSPLALGGVWWQREPFSALVERDATPPKSLRARLQRAHEIVQAAEKLFGIAVAYNPPPPSSVPLKLVYKLEDMRKVMPLEETLTDAASARDDASMGWCLDIATRVVSLVRAHGSLTDEILARDALRPVSAWLLQAVDALKRAREPPLYLESHTVAKLAGADAWLPSLVVARVAGETCSAALLHCACIQAERAFAQGLCIDISACDLPPSHSLPRDDSIVVSTFVLVAFARGVDRGTRGCVPGPAPGSHARPCAHAQDRYGYARLACTTCAQRDNRYRGRSVGARAR
nr:dihydrofolate reductase motif-containing protein [Pandoravirus massiliensis]